jgi:hypothetical protein
MEPGSADYNLIAGKIIFLRLAFWVCFLNDAAYWLILV